MRLIVALRCAGQAEIEMALSVLAYNMLRAINIRAAAA
jgi:hypothetical protein